MAKKHARREHISVRKKREEEQKRMNKKRLTKGQWAIIAGIAAVVIAVALYFILRAPAGALPIRDGQVVKEADNWIVAPMTGTRKPYYFHTANVDIPDGYTRDPEYTVKSDPLFDEVYMRADDPDAVIATAYITTVADGQLGDAILPKGMSYYSDAVGPREVVVNGYTWTYFIGTSPFVENEGDVQRGGAFYLDSPDGRYCISCAVQTKVYSAVNAADAPSFDDVLADVTAILAGVTLPE